MKKIPLLRLLWSGLSLLTPGLPLLGLSPLAAQTPSASPAYWQQQVNYTLEVSLDATEHTLDGFARIQYINRSPDTLAFIWFHLWPNAYKNDETAFSEQLLGNGRTDFYFSDKEQKGYINRLDFRADGLMAGMEDHPQYIDIIKVILPRPLPPGAETLITTPFHEKLPFDFSRGGYSRNAFLVTHWFPQPAVYDRKGWHPQPYLDQGGSYSEFGNFDLRITVPAAWAVVASAAPVNVSSAAPADFTSSGNFTPLGTGPGVKTIRYLQDNIRDFAWFAAKGFTLDHDTLRLASGKLIDLYVCYRPSSSTLWKGGLKNIKEAILFRSGSIGEYPFSTLSAVEAGTTTATAAEYPALIALPRSSLSTITMVQPSSHKHPRSTYKILSPETVDSFRRAINYGVGQQWFSSILGADERSHPWMGGGFAGYYDQIAPYTGTLWSYDDYTMTKAPADRERWNIDIVAAEKKDQPISTSSEDFTKRNYSLIAQTKTIVWLRRLQTALGKELFDSCMRQYFRLWQFRHPDPADFRSVIESTSHRQLDSLFALLDKDGPLIPFPEHRKIKATAIYNHRNTDKIDYINIGPALGYNHYDQFMIGAYIHNLDLPPNRFQFLATPMYATNSNTLTGLGGLSYSWYPDGGSFHRILLALTGSRFSTLSGIDSNGKKIFAGFYKIVPTLRLTLKKPDPRSTVERWMEWKTYLIGEKGFDNYVLKTADSNYYPVIGKYDFRYLNQLSFDIQDQRALYPYEALLQFQQGSAWWRINFTGNYFFNYEHGGGMSLRLFAAKFGYIGGRNASLDLTGFEPKLTGLTGSEDYTYSNYFLGRNEFTGLASQQIMIRDGGLKIRTDLFQGLQGRSDNWIAAVNLNSSLPPGLLPPWFPLKAFLDIGTYAEAWQNDPPTSRFLFVGGFQLTPFRYFNIYVPLFYSRDFGNQLKTVPDQNTFFKKISFSLDFQALSFGKKGPDNPF